MIIYCHYGQEDTDLSFILKQLTGQLLFLLKFQKKTATKATIHVIQASEAILFALLTILVLPQL